MVLKQNNVLRIRCIPNLCLIFLMSKHFLFGTKPIFNRCKQFLVWDDITRRTFFLKNIVSESPIKSSFPSRKGWIRLVRIVGLTDKLNLVCEGSLRLLLFESESIGSIDSCNGASMPFECFQNLNVNFNFRALLYFELFIYYIEFSQAL